MRWKRLSMKAIRRYENPAKFDISWGAKVAPGDIYLLFWRKNPKEFSYH
jgi:hypothetical protein